MSQPTIRRADLADAATLAVLGARTFTETFGHLYPPQHLAEFLAGAYSEAAIGEALAEPRGAVWIAEADGEAVGYVRAGPCALPHPEVTSACGEVKALYLVQGRQNSGLGSRLFDQAITWLLRDGPRTLWIGVWSENYGAQRFYGRHGFEVAGEYGFRVGGTVDREFILRRISPCG
ncbi:GNAT family N-acetyltransferase [Phenylobacterium sp.]|jgi:GNAT superfamily N-acetyltransferase|uniref:GNAT family N-acetyltransferase n=1 Tax=Phenylobacterium sp. TaxID=1871053 RepID=UPI00378364B7